MNKNPTCRLCNAKPEKQFVRASNVYGDNEGDYKFYQCRTCDLVYLWPIPSEEQENYFYAIEFEKYMGNRSGEERDWSGPEAHKKSNLDNVIRRMKFLDNYMKKGASILEIGCSSGFMMDKFRELGLKPVGVEPSGVFTNYLKENGHEVYKNIDDLRSHSNIKFDIIVSFFVLEHIRNTKKFLLDQMMLINQNGIVIAEVPCVNDPLTSLYDIPAFENFYWSIAHHYYFNPKSISVVLDKINCKYDIIPEQRYDLSNHMIWMQKGKPGGQGKYNSIISEITNNNYKENLKSSWSCDTFFLKIEPNKDN
jgi:SAM-dependent methyltransferase